MGQKLLCQAESTVCDDVGASSACVNSFDRYGNIIIGYFGVNVGIATFRLQFIKGAVWATPAPDAGQTKYYDVAGNVITCPSPGQTLYGQDANYSIKPMSNTKLFIYT